MLEGFSLARARLAQRKIAEKVIERDEIEYPLRYAAGVDVAYVGDTAVAAAVVVEYPSLSPVETHVVRTPVRFPYVPTLLAFREAWPAYKALTGLKTRYQVLFVDGNGRLHPFKAGFACHLGLAVGKPTIGVAKKLLVGEVEQINARTGRVVFSGEVLGYAVRLGKSSRYTYISVGHKITLDTALKVTLLFTKKGVSLPEPIRQAHSLATRARAESR